MAALRPSLKNEAAFDPETVQAMSVAFDDVCKALRLKLSETKGREAVAKKIIEMARQGQRNPTLLSLKILRAVGVTNTSADEPEQRPTDKKRYSGM
jgi:hypothetical protein